MRALISVSDKTGVVEFARELEQLGEEIGVKIKCQHEDIFEKMHRI